MNDEQMDERQLKVADLLAQLHEAGATAFELRGDLADVERLRDTPLTAATLQGIYRLRDVDFAAWVAWNLRF